MGRRKIEIQPITHERNRAVTFLKRKNGLFKKAYELGVLCSVDVAVIIFEERPGHQVKLYQYCSSDVNNIVQRHLQFDGERDTKTPVDFSHSKGEDGGDDEDEIDEDEHAHASSSKQTAKKDKSKATAKSKESSGAPSPGTVPIRPAQANPSSESPMELDTRPGTSRTQGIPTPTGSNTTNIVPMLPISSDRLSSAQASRSSLGGGIHMPLPIPINMPSHKRPRTDDPVVPPPGLNFPYRLDVDLNTYPPTAHATSLSHSHSPSHQQHLAYPHNAMGINLGIQSPHAYPQSPAFDIHGRPPINYSQPQRNNSYPPSLEGLFGQRAGPGAQSQTANMLLDLLSSSAGMNMNGNPPPSFPAFDWPVTRSQSSQSEVTGSSQSDATSWLEFLASSPPSVQGTLTLGGLPTPTPTSRTPSSSISSLRPPSPPPSRKRNRDECEDDAGSRRSESTDGMQSLFDP